MAKDVIEHRGKIDWIEGSRVHVHFVSMSACASCHAKGVCTASDMESKEVEVTDSSGRFQEGEDVNILMRRSMGFKALIYGYVIPFLVVLATLIITSSLFASEAVAGIGSLAVLVPYYLWLYYNRERFKKSFHFELQKTI
jgi:sigma-E factor negative regulatory protein RseC